MKEQQEMHKGKALACTHLLVQAQRCFPLPTALHCTNFAVGYISATCETLTLLLPAPVERGMYESYPKKLLGCFEGCCG